MKPIVNVEVRRISAYWYAIGRAAASGDPDRSEAFALFAQQQAVEVNEGRSSHLPSIFDQWEQFIKETTP